MKKQVPVLVVLMALSLSLASVSARERSMDFPTYKCHVVLENGVEKIVQVSAKDPIMAEKHVASRKVSISKKEKIAVKSVSECKAKSEAFTSVTVRTLELNTPD